MPTILILDPIILPGQFILLAADEPIFTVLLHGRFECFLQSLRGLVALGNHDNGTGERVMGEMLGDCCREKGRMVIVVQGVSGKDNLKKKKESVSQLLSAPIVTN
jgi:hypothetical protein